MMLFFGSVATTDGNTRVFWLLLSSSGGAASSSPSPPSIRPLSPWCSSPWMKRWGPVCEGTPSCVCLLLACPLWGATDQSIRTPTYCIWLLLLIPLHHKFVKSVFWQPSTSVCGSWPKRGSMDFASQSVKTVLSGVFLDMLFGTALKFDLILQSLVRLQNDFKLLNMEYF